MVKKRYTAYVLFLLWAILTTGWGQAETTSRQFYNAEAFYQNFLKDPARMKYRDNWLNCIQKFQNAYQENPAGPLAAASLYYAGKLYQDLYAVSDKKSDKEEAIDIYNRLIKRFPDSDYQSKAKANLARLAPGKEADQTDGGGMSVKQKTLAKPGDLTQPVIKPGAKIKRREEVFKQSKSEYRAALNHKPVEEITRMLQTEEKPAPTDVSPPVNAARVNNLRVWSNPNYTRIVVDVDKETDYQHNLLGKDFSSSKPQRLYIDFFNSFLGNIDKVIPIDDDLLTSARAAQYTPSTVRVVIDIKSFKNYKIFSLRNPFRTVIDVWGRDVSGEIRAEQVPVEPRPQPQPEQPQPEQPQPEQPQMEQPQMEQPQMEQPQPERPLTPSMPSYKASRNDPHVSPNDLVQQLALGVRRIVIDPGHGGHDAGAPGFFKGVNEKDIVLQIGLRLAQKIRRELGCQVIMTRDSDRFLSLEERTAIANTRNADLFISIHCNAHQNHRAYGIETYFLNLATDDDAILVAARENATSRKNISDLQNILNDLMQNSKINESSKLAAYTQKSLYNHLKGRYSDIKNKGVKQAPFYVLLGAQMPSILIETSFISNKQECKRLLNANYQDHLCNGIITGIREYMREISPTAFMPGRGENG
jgi:N-acetylmuramoyl-L-alanine amidase